MSKIQLTEKKFSDFALHQLVIELIDYKSFNNCTSIKALTLPVTLAGKVSAGQAQTGTGKTLAFLTATFHHLLNHHAAERSQTNQPSVLIMAPTRELAVQIHSDAEPISPGDRPENVTGLRQRWL